MAPVEGVAGKPALVAVSLIGDSGCTDGDNDVGKGEDEDEVEDDEDDEEAEEDDREEDSFKVMVSMPYTHFKAIARKL